MIVERPALERRVLESLDAGRIPVVLGGCAAGRTSLLLRLRSFFGEARAQYIDFAAAATTPERCLTAIVRSAPPGAQGAVQVTPGTARAAFDGLTGYFTSATADAGRPLTFLIDEVQDVRTFESFPGLKHVQRDLVTRLAASPNAFVLTSRFTARAHRLLRDAPARFEVIHMPPLTAEEVQLLVRQVTDDRAADDAAWPSALTGDIAALSGGRAGYARLLIDAVAAQPGRARDPRLALAAALSPDGALTARCRESYEFRLHRARGYGALKAILGVLAGQQDLTLTEISQHLHRTPGSTKDYLSWLEDVDLVTVHRKRYAYADPLLRLFVRLYAQPAPPPADEILRESAAYADDVLPSTVAAPPASLAAAPAARMPVSVGDRSGIIEID